MAKLGCDFKYACEWISREFCIPMAGGGYYPPTVTHIRKQKKAPDADMLPHYSYIPSSYMHSTLSEQSSFCQCMRMLFPSHRVHFIAEEYNLGMIGDGCDDIIFWNVDAQGNVCNGKVQRYCTDASSSAFFHSDRKVCYWVAKSVAKTLGLPADASFCSSSLFGEHLLPHYPDAVVALVESPKNALIGAAEYPQLVWVAAGNKGNLKHAIIPLRNRQVIVFPDRDAIADWKSVISQNREFANFHVSDFCERYAPADSPKFDIADYIIGKRIQNTSKA